MDRMQVELLCHECGITFGNNFADDCMLYVLTRFANLVALNEREACAAVCENVKNHIITENGMAVELDAAYITAKKCAALIRNKR